MKILLIINSIGHFFVDAVCAAALFGSVRETGDMTAAILLYNTLAFSTQCVTGLIADRLKRHELMASLSLAATALGLLLPLHWLLRVVVIGLGNSFFHVAGGAATLENANGRAAPLGVFVAPGALGLTIGTLYPQGGALLGIGALIIAGVLLLLARKKELRRGEAAMPVRPKLSREQDNKRWLAVGALLVAVAVRAVGGTAVIFPWKSGARLAMTTTYFVFSGKMVGGFLCDRFGVRRTAVLTVPVAAVLIAFCSSWMLPSLAGQLLLNISMPVTLWLIFLLIPDSPGFAFGLAASALWPGTILGQFLTLTGPALWLCILACMLLGLAAILYSQRKIEEVSIL